MEKDTYVHITHVRKVLPQKKNLVSHLKKHENDKPYSCNICQKKFSQNSDLKKHTEKKHNV